MFVAVLMKLGYFLLDSNVILYALVCILYQCVCALVAKSSIFCFLKLLLFGILMCILCHCIFQWRKGLKLSGETTVEKITLDGVRGLRVTLSATVHDVLYYMSPIYCQDIINSVLVISIFPLSSFIFHFPMNKLFHYPSRKLISIQVPILEGHLSQ